MAGLQKILKMYGSIKATDTNGKTVVWIWDYVNDQPRLKSEMTKQELAANEKAKWQSIAKQD